MDKKSNRRGLLRRGLNTEIFAVSDAPDVLLKNVLTSGDYSAAQLGKALRDRYLNAGEPGLGGYRTGNQNAAHENNNYLAVFKIDKERVITKAYNFSIKLLGRLLITANGVNGPADILNIDLGVGNHPEAVVHGDIEGVDADLTADHSTKILRKFGQFRIKEALATAVGNSIEWLEDKAKKIAGIDIPKQVIEKKKKPL